MKQKGSFGNYFHIFLPIRNMFVCSKLPRNKTKLLFVKKIFGNRPEQKVLDKNVLELKTFRFGPEFCLKNEYIRSFWNKSSKTKASESHHALQAGSNQKIWWILINYQLNINQIIDIFNLKIKLLGDPASWQPLARLDVVDSINKGLYLFIQVVYCLCTLYNVQYLYIFV